VVKFLKTSFSIQNFFTTEGGAKFLLSF